MFVEITLEKEKIKLIQNGSLPGGTRIASFDFDWTLTRPKSNRTFPKDADDITLLFKKEVIKTKLENEIKDGKRIVIFSNQSAKKSDTFKKRIEWFLRQMDYLPMTFICSLEDNLYRKPEPGMWNYYFSRSEDKQGADLKNSFYVGDAAGRKECPGFKKDFSCSDRKFAYNVGIKFYTPEEYFLEAVDNRNKNWDWGGFNPISYIPCREKVTFESKPLEMIIMTGPPGSGKSTFTKEYLQDHYIVINQDTLKTKAKCLKEATLALESSSGVVIDNTNPSPEVRREYIKLAKRYSCSVRSIIMDTELSLAKHLTKVRYRLNPDKCKPIPNIVFNIYNKKFKEPSLDEGFSEIIKVPLVLKDPKEPFYMFS